MAAWASTPDGVASGHNMSFVHQSMEHDVDGSGITGNSCSYIHCSTFMLGGFPELLITRHSEAPEFHLQNTFQSHLSNNLFRPPRV